MPLAKRLLIIAGLLCLACVPCQVQAQGVFGRVRDRVHARLVRRFQKTLQRQLSSQQARKVGDSLIRTVERLIRVDPRSRPLRTLHCEMAVSFSFAFKEDQDQELAQSYYQKAQSSAKALLKRRYPKQYTALTKAKGQGLKKALKAIKKADTDLVFWYAFAQGMEINLIRSTPLLVRVPRVQVMLEWVKQRDGSLFNAGPDLALAMLYCAFPKAAGRDLKKAKAHFEAVERITGRRWLLARVIRARCYSPALQAEFPKNSTPQQRRQAQMTAWKDFRTQLESVLSASKTLWPSRGLYNRVAKDKARDMLAQADDWILLPQGVSNPYAPSDDSD